MAMLITNRKICILLLLPLLLIAEEIGYFQPPKDWDCANPASLSPNVEIAFFTKMRSNFHPSINLAKEATDIPLKEYLKIVKKIHSSEPDTSWRDLGSLTCKAGKGRLTEISQKNHWGDLRLLQFIFLHGGVAYVLTGASTKEDFPKVRKPLIDSFRSFTITNDLFQELTDSKQLDALNQWIAYMEKYTGTHNRKNCEKEWKKVQKKILQDVDTLGPHFQFLLIKDLHQTKIQPLLEQLE